MYKNQNTKNVKSWRIRAKQKLVDICGGKCNVCGYDKCTRALEFHHLNEDNKDFGISQLGHTHSFESSIKEIQKCVLLCSNCHREVHDGITIIKKKQKYNKKLIEKYLKEIAYNRERRKQYNYCYCGNKKVTTRKYCSHKCSTDIRQPSKLNVDNQEIILLYEQFKNYEKVGRCFGVTGAAIKRRLKKITHITGA